MTQPALHDLGVAQLATELRERRVSAVEAAQHFLDRAQTHQHLGAFVALNEEATLAQARAADARLATGTAGALEGVPLAHKDIFVTRDFPSTAGSKMLAGYRSPFDATVVTRLAEAGCVTLGKLNCDEFAMGSANENSAVAPVGFDAPAPVRNPWDTARIFSTMSKKPFSCVSMRSLSFWLSSSRARWAMRPMSWDVSAIGGKWVGNRM